MVLIVHHHCFLWIISTFHSLELTLLSILLNCLLCHSLCFWVTFLHHNRLQRNKACCSRQCQGLSLCWNDSGPKARLIVETWAGKLFEVCQAQAPTLPNPSDALGEGDTASIMDYEGVLAFCFAPEQNFVPFGMAFESCLDKGVDVLTEKCQRTTINLAMH